MTISLHRNRNPGPKLAADHAKPDAPPPAAAGVARAPRAMPDCPVVEAVKASDPGVLLTPRDAAARLQVTAKVLERWRSVGGGPKFVMLSSKTIRYQPTDLDDFVAARTATRTGTAGK